MRRHDFLPYLIAARLLGPPVSSAILCAVVLVLLWRI